MLTISACSIINVFILKDWGLFLQAAKARQLHAEFLGQQDKIEIRLILRAPKEPAQYFDFMRGATSIASQQQLRLPYTRASR